MQHALKQFKRPLVETKKEKSKTRRKAKNVLKSKSIFYVFMVVAIVCASIALTRVVLSAFYNQYALENEQLKQRLATVEQVSQELVSKKLVLESPARIETIAKNTLNMDKPANIRYIIYREKETGSRLALKSSY